MEEEEDAAEEAYIRSFRSVGLHEMFHGRFFYWDQTRDNDGTHF